MAVAIPFVPTRIGAGDYTDFQAVVGASDDGKVWAWSDAQQKFAPVALNYEPAGAVATHAALTSGVHGISAFGATLIDDAAASNARTTLGLGTAATLNVGTSANNIVQLDGSAKLPAVDGSLLTNLPSGGGGSPGGSTTQVQYNNAGAFAGDAGLTYDAANDALTVAGRVVTGVIRPAADSTTAVQVQTAAGTAVVTVDTTNRHIKAGSTTGRIIWAPDIAGYFEIVNSGTNVDFQSYSNTPIRFQNAGGGSITFGSSVTFSNTVTLAGTSLQIGGGNGITISAP